MQKMDCDAVVNLSNYEAQVVRDPRSERLHVAMHMH